MRLAAKYRSLQIWLLADLSDQIEIQRSAGIRDKPKNGERTPTYPYKCLIPKRSIYQIFVWTPFAGFCPEWCWPPTLHFDLSGQGTQPFGAPIFVRKSDLAFHTAIFCLDTAYFCKKPLNHPSMLHGMESTLLSILLLLLFPTTTSSLPK